MTRRKTNKSPLTLLLDAGRISRAKVCRKAECSVETLRRLERGKWDLMYLQTLCRIAIALGCAPAELIPELARRPREGLLYDAGVYERPKR